MNSRLPKSLRHFYGIFTKVLPESLRIDLNLQSHHYRGLTDEAFDSLIKGVRIPNTIFTMYISGKYYIILIDGDVSSLDFGNKDISSSKDDTTFSTIEIPTPSIQESFKSFSEKYHLSTAAIHNLVWYTF